MKKASLGLLAACLTAASSAWATVGGGDLTFTVEGATNVVYSHEFHVTNMKLKCSNCHYKIFNMSRSGKKTSMVEMQKGKSCGACHNGTQAFDVKDNCSKCHK